MAPTGSDRSAQGQIRFRRITGADAAEFFELRRRAILAGCTGYYSDEVLRAWTDPSTDGSLADRLTEHFYFAEINGEIRGSGTINIHSGRIDAIFVHPISFRQGLGTAIVQHLEQIARTLGLRRLVLDATLNAADFYRSLGFEGDTTGTYASSRGIVLPCLPMTKSLT